MQSKHILLTTDLSEEAERAFEPVKNLAQWTGANVTLMHVVQVVTTVPPGSMLAAPLTLGHPEEDVKTAQEAIEVHRKALGDDVEVECVVSTGENVGKEIVRWAEAHDVGLIAISTHGRSGLRRVLLGSVAEDIMRRSHIPVLCFPPAK